MQCHLDGIRRTALRLWLLVISPNNTFAAIDLNNGTRTQCRFHSIIKSQVKNELRGIEEGRDDEAIGGVLVISPLRT